MKTLLEMHREEQREAAREKCLQEFYESLQASQREYNRALRRMRQAEMIHKAIWIGAMILVWGIIVATFIRAEF